MAQVRHAFFAGMRPGDWLGTEAELAERFGVSRVTIRDAVRTLETRGIVDVRVGAGGGLRIADADPDRFHEALAVQLHLMGVEFAELLDAQSAIEPFTAQRAAQLRTEEQLAAIRGTLRAQHLAVDDAVRFTDAGNAFHVAVADASGNRVLRATLEALSGIRLAAYSPRANPRRARRVLKVHQEILAAIEARDGDLARRLMTDHVQFVRSQRDIDPIV